MQFRSALLLSYASLCLACSGDEPEVIDCSRAGACQITIVSGDMQTAEVGALLPDALVVKVTHVASNTVPPPVTLEWTASEGGGSLTPDSTVIDGVMGEAQTNATIGTVAGETSNTFTVQIKDQPDSAITFVAGGTSGPARMIEVVSGSGQTAEVGTVLPEALVVRVVDQYGNPVADRRVAWVATAGDGDVEGESAASDENGEVRATATLGEIAGDENNLYTATSPQLPGSARFTATAMPGPAAILEKVDGDRQGGTRGELLPVPLTVQVTDLLGNAIEGVTVEFEAGVGDGMIESASVVTDEEGAASTIATLGADAGEHVFTATVEGLMGSPAVFTGIAFPPICSPNEWCWASPIPQGNTINGSYALAPDDVWIVGDRGTTLRWIGTAWEGYLTSTEANLNAVWGAAADDVWAVGDGGTILRFNGFSWTSVQSGTSLNLTGIVGAGPNDIWAVGDTGTLLHWDGMNWLGAQSPTTENLNGITKASDSNFWAVGDRAVTLTLAQSTWEVVDVTVTNEDLNAVHALTGTDIWAVGDGDTYIRWNGTVWLAFAGNSQFDLRDVWGSSTSPNDVWAVGDRGRIRRFDGSRWNPVISRTADDLNTISPTSRGLLAAGNGGLVMRRVDNEWQPESRRRLHTLQGVWGPAPDDIWAVGANGTILHWDGAAWTDAPEIPNAQIYAVHGSGTDDVWAVGELGFVTHWDGSTWSSISSGASVTLNGIHALSSTHAFAVGAEGTVIEWDGTSWSSVAVPTMNTLYGVWAANGGDVWVFGDFGAVLHYDGTAWVTRADITTESFLGVRGTAANDIWAFGVNGALLHYNGTDWMPVASNTTATLFGMSVGPNDDLWLSGDGGTVLRFNGSLWVRQNSGTANTLYGVYSPEAGDTWVVGESATILRQNP
ncbi:MAG: hypothetical protein RIT81_38080 [Deltaproteobacteria bacterium]